MGRLAPALNKSNNMYALIETRSHNGKPVTYKVYYNDVLFELHDIEINGTWHDLSKMTELRRDTLYFYMLSNVNVWKEIRKFERETYDAFF